MSEPQPQGPLAVPGVPPPLLWAIAAAGPVLVLVTLPFLYMQRGILGSLRMIWMLYDVMTIVLPLILLGAAGAWAFAAWRDAAPRYWRRVVAALAVCAVGLFMARVYATHIEPRRLLVREAELRSAAVKAPLRILHITDIQAGAIGEREREAFATMAALKPDIVLHTGDLLQPVAPATWETELAALVPLLESLDPPGGVWNVPGDVDMPLHMRLLVPRGGMATLFSEGTVIDLPQGRIALFGLDIDHSREPDTARALAREFFRTEGADGALRIVLGHSPDFMLGMEGAGAALCLAGHTHGGQVRVPLFGPPVTFSRVPREWARGFRTLPDGTAISVSAGIGAERDRGMPPIRFNCPPEMTLITVRP
jgi:predicted MPP superfamily phosphohydrolase